MMPSEMLYAIGMVTIQMKAGISSERSSILISLMVVNINSPTITSTGLFATLGIERNNGIVVVLPDGQAGKEIWEGLCSWGIKRKLQAYNIYDFNRIGVNDIVEHLQYVAEKEGIETDVEGLNIIAH